MLVLNRKSGESLMIGENLEVIVMKTRGEHAGSASVRDATRAFGGRKLSSVMPQCPCNGATAAVRNTVRCWSGVLCVVVPRFERRAKTMNRRKLLSNVREDVAATWGCFCTNWAGCQPAQM